MSEKLAFDAMLAQMSDESGSDEESVVDAKVIAPAKPPALPPTKPPAKPPGKPPAKPSRPAASKALHKNDGYGEVEDEEEEERSYRHYPSESKSGGSVVDKILVARRTTLPSGLLSSSGGGGGGGYSTYEGNEGLDEDDQLAEIEKFGGGGEEIAPRATAASRASSIPGSLSLGERHAPTRSGSLMGGLPSADDKYATTRKWLTRPCPKGEPPFQCYVERERNMLSMQATFRCFMDPTEDQSARFLMAAKKKPGKQAVGSYYLVSMEMNPDDRGSEALLGKVRANAVGSQYSLTDHGLAPDRTQAPSTLRKELGLVRFQFDSGGPSRMEVWIPAVQGSTAGSVATWQPLKEADSIEVAVNNRDLDKLTVLQSKHPKVSAG